MKTYYLDGWLEVGRKQAWTKLQTENGVCYLFLCMALTWRDLSHRAKFCRRWALRQHWNQAVALHHWCHQLTIASVVHQRLDCGVRGTSIFTQNIYTHSFKIYDIWPQTNKQANTHMCNGVLLVWGSLRLAPINSVMSVVYDWLQLLCSASPSPNVP